MNEVLNSTISSRQMPRVEYEEITIDDHGAFLLQHHCCYSSSVCVRERYDQVC